MGEKLRGEKDYQFIAVEPASCPSFTRGKFAYDYCDTGMVCPLAKMDTLGSGFIPVSYTHLDNIGVSVEATDRWSARKPVLEVKYSLPAAFLLIIPSICSFIES